MTYKNLDKPLRTTMGMLIETFNSYHGTQFRSWPELAAYFGLHHQMDNYHGRFYKAYLNWCKLANTPLYKALS